MRQRAEGAEAVAGCKLPAVANADASRSLPTPALAHTKQSAGLGGGALALSISGEEGRDSWPEGMGDAHLGHLRRSVRPNFDWRPQWRARAVLLQPLGTPFWSEVK